MIKILDKKTICLVSSSGGHLAQLMELEDTLKYHELYWVVEKNKITEGQMQGKKVYYLFQQDRKKISIIIKLFLNFLKSLLILLKSRPDVVITTGAGCVIPLCLFSKIIFSKVIFIESFAKVNSPTLTGRIIYKFKLFNRFYIQSEKLKKYYPKARYKGAIY